MHVILPDFLRTSHEIRFTPDFYTTKDTWGKLSVASYCDDTTECMKGLLASYAPDKRNSSSFNLSHLSEYWRGHIYRHVAGWSVILRKIPTQIPGLVDLGFTPVELLGLCSRRGVTLFGGPMDSGKSTTMASCVEELRKAGTLGEAITIEDPIEFRYIGSPYIEQREVGTHVNSYKDGVVDAMRESKETIIIGEIRHQSTAEAAVQAGLTGHRVMATIHADSVIDCMNRMLSLLSEPYRELLPSAMQGISAQYLFRPGDQPPVPIYETLEVDTVCRSIIQGGPKSLTALKSHFRQQHRQTLSDRAQVLVRKKFITEEMARPWITI